MAPETVLSTRKGWKSFWGVLGYLHWPLCLKALCSPFFTGSSASTVECSCPWDPHSLCWTSPGICILPTFVIILRGKVNSRPAAIVDRKHPWRIVLGGAAGVTVRAGPSKIGVRPTLAGTQQKPLSTGKRIQPSQNQRWSGWVSVAVNPAGGNCFCLSIRRRRKEWLRDSELMTSQDPSERALSNVSEMKRRRENEWHLKPC